MSDPTDPGGVGAQAERGRSSTRVGDSGSPVGSPLTIVLALIAVVVGFLIFRSIDDSDAGGIEVPTGATTVPEGATTTVAGGAAATTAPSATTSPTLVTDGAAVIVANASVAGGEAQNMQDALEEAGFTVTDEATSDLSDTALEESIVYYTEGVPAIQAVAESVAQAMGGLSVQPMPSPIPVEGGSIGTATVLVMLGNDTAGASLDDLQAAAGSNVAAPTPAGGATTSSAG